MAATTRMRRYSRCAPSEDEARFAGLGSRAGHHQFRQPGKARKNELSLHRSSATERRPKRSKTMNRQFCLGTTGVAVGIGDAGGRLPGWHASTSAAATHRRPPWSASADTRPSAGREDCPRLSADQSRSHVRSPGGARGQAEGTAAGRQSRVIKERQERNLQFRCHRWRDRQSIRARSRSSSSTITTVAIASARRPTCCALTKANPDLRFVLKEFPILGPDSQKAHMVSHGLPQTDAGEVRASSTTSCSDRPGPRQAKQARSRSPFHSALMRPSCARR